MVFDPSTLQLNHLLGPFFAAFLGAAGSLGRLTGTDAVKSERLSVVLTGAVAGVASIYLLDPESGPKFVAACVAAGYLGQSVLDSFTARIRVQEVKAANAELRGELMQVRAEQAQVAQQVALTLAHVTKVPPDAGPPVQS